jgi:peptidoglycan hydrolase-like protein with peptidoglycan-binding domain
MFRYTPRHSLKQHRFQRGGITVFLFRVTLALLVSAALITPPANASRIHRAPTSGQTHKTHKLTHKTRRPRGQQAIEPERVAQIQQALIREHYLSGEATGKWDATTVAAMQKYQGDQGWQTKLMPDSRALKKLGLGPDYSGAINAKDSSFAAPPPVNTIPQDQAAGFATAAGVNQ